MEKQCNRTDKCSESPSRRLCWAVGRDVKDADTVEKGSAFRAVGRYSCNTSDNKQQASSCPSCLDYENAQCIHKVDVILELDWISMKCHIDIHHPLRINYDLVTLGALGKVTLSGTLLTFLLTNDSCYRSCIFKYPASASHV